MAPGQGGSTASPELASGAAVQCYHCTLPADPSVEVFADIEGSQRAFCCTGCKSVCEAIYAAGLQGFYKRTPDGLPLAPPPDIPA
ncbi:MAG: hypothetical protein GY927_24205, partial [bacterium]|nr:hypothetical protein [bacterium]